VKLQARLILKNETGSALLVVLIIGFLVASTSMLTLLSTKNSTSRISSRRKVVSVFNIAEAGKEHALAQIRTGSLTPVTGTCLEIFMDELFEDGNYSVTYDANANVDTVWLFSLGSLGEKTAQVNIVCALNPVTSQINPSIQAAVTTRGPTTVSGNITVDGNDWNAAGTAVVGTGVYGVKSSGIVSVDGSCQVGGRGTPPTTAPTLNEIDHQCGSTEVPSTPEEALGLPPGALDPYKTDVVPTFPFSGIYYYTGTTIIQPHFSGSSGILIVHNDTYTGSLKNLKETFTGIIIADKIDHVNGGAKIVGALITLSPTVDGNALGIGDSDILYSSEVINGLVSTFNNIVTDTTVDVVSWKQVE
jgi:hypothetical protein